MACASCDWVSGPVLSGAVNIFLTVALAVMHPGQPAKSLTFKKLESHPNPNP